MVKHEQKCAGGVATRPITVRFAGHVVGNDYPGALHQSLRVKDESLVSAGETDPRTQNLGAERLDMIPYRIKGGDVVWLAG